MRDAFIRKLTELAQEDPRIVLLTGDLGFGVLNGFVRDLPTQFINAGVAEQNMTAIAAGLALNGFKAYTYSIANFTTLRCLEQIRNDVCYHDGNVTVVSVGGGFSYGQLGMSHFATEDLAIMRALPQLRVIAPAELWEVEDLTEELQRNPAPTYLRIDKSVGGVLRREGERAEIGRARMIRDGGDLTIVTVGGILKEAVDAAAILEEQGIASRILSVSSLKPFDTEAIIAAARETGGIISLEEHSVIGGLGGVIAETLLECGVMPGFFQRLGLEDCYPSVVGDQLFLRKTYGLDAAAVVEAAHACLGGRR